MALLLLIGAAILGVYIVIVKMRAEKITKNTVVAFTGSLGTGKTYIGTHYAKKCYRKQKIKHLLYSILPKPLKSLIHGGKEKARLYSNIPIIIGHKHIKLTGSKRKKSVPLYSTPLSSEVITLKKRIPESSIIFIDEIGQFASQYDYDNPRVMEQFHHFVRFYRHFIDGRLIVTDQSSDNIVVQLRRRINLIYNLNDFKRFWFIMPYYKVNVTPVLSLEGIKQAETVEEKERYFFGSLPYWWQKKKRIYDSRCYSQLYYKSALRQQGSSFFGIKTRYFIDLNCENGDKREYTRNKQKYQEYLYNLEKYQENSK